MSGPTVVLKGSTQFTSDDTVMGALQIPPDGQPILLMGDRQTIGGYPKVAVVISADLHSMNLFGYALNRKRFASGSSSF